MSKRKATRNKAITALYQDSSLTGEEIGRKFGISRQRVVEIALAYGAKRRKSRSYGSVQARAEWVFQVIVNYKLAHDGLSPTYREIGDVTGLAHSVIHKAILHLEKTGQVQRLSSNNSRAIMVTGGKWIYEGV